MSSRRVAPFALSVLLLIGSTDLAAQRPQPVGISYSSDSAAAKVQTPPDLACAARRAGIVGGTALVGVALGRLVYALGNLLSSDHGTIYKRERRHWEAGGAVFLGGFSALTLVAVTCDQLASGRDEVRLPPRRVGFH